MLHSIKGNAAKRQLWSRHHGQLVHRIRQAYQLKMPMSKTENKGRRGAFQGGREQPFNAGELLPTMGGFC